MNTGFVVDSAPAQSTEPSSPSIQPALAALAGDFLSEDAFAQFVGKSLRTIRRWHSDRTGPARTKIGRKILYKKSAVVAWLSAHETHPPRSDRRHRRGR